MSWPVQIIPPGDKVPQIKWMKWFFYFLCGIAVAGGGWGGAKILAPAEGEADLFVVLLFLWLFFYSIVFLLEFIIMVSACLRSKQENSRRN
ncbi:hypothetical protein J5S76_06745 [Bacillus amyloliquefaciens]|nr:hypothetical protein [Bacillus amyloliquefaciens]